MSLKHAKVIRKSAVHGNDARWRHQVNHMNGHRERRHRVADRPWHEPLAVQVADARSQQGQPDQQHQPDLGGDVS